MAEPRPFRFGAAAEGARTRAEWVALARRAEALGYATFVIPDHFNVEFPPIAALMAAADATTTLRIASYVFDNDFRHPTVLAKEAAALDLLSDGRLELGIGAGWDPNDYHQTGLPMEGPRQRIERLAESITILRRFFTEETVTFAGAHYQVRALPATPKPAQRPHPPFFIGGGGQRVLTLAGREADIVGIHFKLNADGTADPSERTEAALARKIAWVRAAAGERFAAIELNLLPNAVIVTGDRAQAAEAIAQGIIARRGPGSITTEAVLASPYWLLGSVDEIEGQLRHLRAAYGVSYWTMRTPDVETLAP
ncbi:MAG TPA: TIGR03621 family F420-dependent LLM class oxidoreductase, partial [Ktedonobacterales bacterium]|nr:TIGR03621 family F420-dependent LLM class oxidoreductase [Ktedonobacterales bacterium]